MDADAVARAIAREGAAANAQPLFRKLASGEPIVLGVFGASVAQNAGCLAQGNRRCMRYSGIQTTALPWGNPYVRPFKGWAVRLLDHINATYPHPSHRINNSGLDATPAAVALDCLFSYLPSMMDIAILEFGSMAMWNSHSLWSIEAIVRHFMALPSPPMLVLLSVHNWCNGVRARRMDCNTRAIGTRSRKRPSVSASSMVRLAYRSGALCSHSFAPANST